MDPHKSPKTDPHVKSSTNPRPAGTTKGRIGHKAEDEAREQAGTGLRSDTVRGRDARMDREIAESAAEDGAMPTGTQTGQTTRGAYSTDPATGASRYADHREGQFGTDPVAQPGDDNDREPDPLDPKI